MIQTQLVLPTNDLPKDLEYFSVLGFKLKHIFPDDAPEVAIMFGYGIEFRLDKNCTSPAPTLQVLTDNPKDFNGGLLEFTAPNGTKINVSESTYSMVIPPTVHEFEVRKLRDADPWVIGRAGMLYRDLVPGRLGGGIMASHIRIPKGGPVPDMVHYHTIGFQLIYCYKGWVKLVYEDQGEPFILSAGDCVNQPPEIRHRVLEASDNLEVIEIGIPAEHMTTIDHEMELPNGILNTEREFKGQKFCHHKEKDTEWKPWRLDGFEYRDSGINKATVGVASVEVGRVNDVVIAESKTSHSSDILFNFVLVGELDLKMDGHEIIHLKKGDAYVIPPKKEYGFLNLSKDVELLEVSLPGEFDTIKH